MTYQDLLARLDHLKSELNSADDPQDNLSFAKRALGSICRDLSRDISETPDTVRVLRLLEYTGPRAAVEAQVTRRLIKVSGQFGPVRVRETFLSEFPESIVGYVDTRTDTIDLNPKPLRKRREGHLHYGATCAHAGCPGPQFEDEVAGSQTGDAK
jgi:hypothetical protein